MAPQTVEYPYIRIGGATRYSRHGDTVSLYAERLENTGGAGGASGNLAVQLWACEAPFDGGALAGRKVAEFRPGVIAAGDFLSPVEAGVPAAFPEHGEYSMVLAVVEWDGEGFNRIHDFHNYPERDLFLHPRLEGRVGYRCIDAGRVRIDVDATHNPRGPDNLSGTLALELWALPQPYAGGDFAGHPLAGITLGPVAGGVHWRDCSYELEMTQPPAGAWTLVLMLREWAATGYVTRDYTNFSQPVTFPLNIPETPAGEAVGADGQSGQEPPDSVAETSEDPAEVVDDVQTGAPAEAPAASAAAETGRAPGPRKNDEPASAETLVDRVKRIALYLLSEFKRRW